MNAELINELFSPLFSDEQGRYQDRLNAEVLQIIYDHKLFKCFLPVETGGLGMNMKETLEIIEACAYANGSLGWLIQIGNGGNYFAEYFSPKTYRELFSPGNAVIAGSGAVTGTGIQTEGGYMLTGQWKYCSGSDYASIFTVSFTDQTDATVHSCVLMPEQVEVIRDWNTSGLKNTSTNSIRVKNAFVPPDRVFHLSEKKQSLSSDVFGFPFLPYAQLFFIKTIRGIFRRLIAEVLMLGDEKGKGKIPNSERILHLRNIAENDQQLLRELDRIILSFVEHPVLTSGEDERVALFDAEICRFTHTLREHAHELFRSGGMNVLYADHPVNIFYQDLLCVSQHKLLNRFDRKD